MARQFDANLGDVCTFTRAGKWTWKVEVVDTSADKFNRKKSSRAVSVDDLFADVSTKKTVKKPTKAQLAARERFATLHRKVKCYKCETAHKISEMEKRTIKGKVVMLGPCCAKAKVVKRGSAVIEEPNTPVYVKSGPTKREIRKFLGGKSAAQKESLRGAIALGYEVPK